MVYAVNNDNNLRGQSVNLKSKYAGNLSNSAQTGRNDEPRSKKMANDDPQATTGLVAQQSEPPVCKHLSPPKATRSRCVKSKRCVLSVGIDRTLSFNGKSIHNKHIDHTHSLEADS